MTAKIDLEAPSEHRVLSPKQGHPCNGVLGSNSPWEELLWQIYMKYYFCLQNISRVYKRIYEFDFSRQTKLATPYSQNPLVMAMLK